MTELQPGQVTIADLYRELVGMRHDVGKALVKIEVIDSRNVASDAVAADHESRLRSLEAFRWKVTGLTVTVASAAGIASGVVANHLH